MDLDDLHAVRPGRLRLMGGATARKPCFAFVIPWPIDTLGGVNHVIHHLARECALDGAFEPLYLESHWDHVSPVEDRVEGIRRIRFRMRAPVHEGNRWSAAWLARLPFEIATWRRVIRENHIRAINPYFPALYQLTPALLRRCGAYRGKFIPTFQGSDVRIALAAAPAEAALLRWMLRQSDNVVACSRGLGEELLTFDRALAPKLEAILNGVSAEEFLARRDPSFDPGAVIPAGRRLVLNVASYEYRKGHDLLLPAFRMASDRIPNLHLAVVGAKGPELDKIRAMAAELGIAGRVSLMVNEPYDRIPAYMARAELFVLTSRWIQGKMGEGLPLSLMEAGAAGVPVVSTRSTGVDEVMTDGLHGRVVPVEDPPALAAAMEEMLAHRDTARQRAELFRRRAVDEFSWKSRWRMYRQLCEA